MNVLTTEFGPARRKFARSAALLVLTAILLLATSATRAGGSIFDDDYAPPKRAEPAPKPQPGPPAVTPDKTPVPTPAPIAPPVAPVAGGSRSLIPDRASRAACRKLFEEVFAKELKDSSKDARKKFAQRLLDEGLKAANASPDRFVLLCGAMQAAEEADNLRISFAAAEELAKSYDMDELAAKVDAATKVFGGPQSPMVGSVYNVEAVFRLADRLAAQDDFADVSRVEAALAHNTVSINEPELRTEAMNQIHEMTALCEAEERARPVMEQLNQNPADRSLNAVVGNYLCFGRGTWEQGLPLLAKSNDQTLKALAMAELHRPAEPDAVAALGDGWWDVASKMAGPDRQMGFAHAVDLYRSVEPNLSGLRKLAIDKRMAEAPPASARLHRVDLLEMFDSDKSPLSGSWRIQDGQLVTDQKNMEKLQFAYLAPDEYDYRLSFTVVRSGSNVSQLCCADGHQFGWHAGGWKNKISAFEMVAGAGGADNKTTTHAKQWFVSGRHYTTLVKVRKTGVEGYINDQLTTSYKTDYSDMSSVDDWKLPITGTVGIGAWDVAVRFDLAEIIEITGEGKLLPR